MNTLYLDLFSGISGDMFLGALIDLGVDAHRLEHELEKLNVKGYHLHAARGQKSGIAGVKFDVHVGDEPPHTHTESQGHGHGHSHAHEHPHAHPHAGEHGAITSPQESHEHGRTFAEIRQLIQASSLSDWVKEKSIGVFSRIAAAEGKIHGLPAEEVHFHEVGAVDSIVDIVGSCIGLEMLGRPRVLAGEVVEGWGWVDCAHGRFPVPAPATLAILGARGIALTQCQEPHELVTPTGAALLAEFVEQFGPMRGLVAQRIGFGLGTRDNKTRPNVLRAVLGRTASTEAAHDWEQDRVAVLETNLDDLSAEVLGYVVERALAAGALDVFHTPIQMKKNRPGVLLTILCAEDDADRFAELILRETSAFGVRRTVAERRKLRRELVTVKTAHGEVKVKVGTLDGRVVQAAPEYEDCRALAAKAGVPLREVYAEALRQFRSGEH